MSDARPERGVIHIVDDDRGVRESLQALLGAAGFATRAHPSASALLAAADAAAAGCLIVDVRMPVMSGIELLHRLRELGRRTPVIVVTGHADVPMAVQAMKLGAADFIEKPFRAQTMIEAVRGALAQDRRTPASDAIACRAQGLLRTLTEREREVLVLLADGHSNKTVARDLDISPRTVETHRARIMAKLQARSLSQLVRIALNAGMLALDQQ